MSASDEQRPTPETPAAAADLADKYERMLRLADLFDSSGQEMRTRSKLGAEVDSSSHHNLL